LAVLAHLDGGGWAAL